MKNFQNAVKKVAAVNKKTKDADENVNMLSRKDLVFNLVHSTQVLSILKRILFFHTVKLLNKY